MDSDLDSDSDDSVHVSSKRPAPIMKTAAESVSRSKTDDLGSNGKDAAAKKSAVVDVCDSGLSEAEVLPVKAPSRAQTPASSVRLATPRRSTPTSSTVGSTSRQRMATPVSRRGSVASTQGTPSRYMSPPDLSGLSPEEVCQLVKLRLARADTLIDQGSLRSCRQRPTFKEKRPRAEDRHCLL